ncbi:hypothetical protein [Actinosynnema sp. NPDC020468]|uniref:hypothetical protein n=1 Tax=Actinosynnema sp. NPDC020468 TaxID=3154488 RepID=UPI0033FD44C0
MTGNVRRSGPPWSVDLLADLHAGALDARTEAELRPIVENDPEALEILAALDATLDDLRNLPDVPMPAAVAARIDAALAAEARGGAGVVVDLAAARRRKRLGWGAGLLAAAAVAVGVVVVALPKGGSPVGDVAAPPAATPSTAPADSSPQPSGGSAVKIPEVAPGDLGAVLGDVLKAQNYGPLENQETLAGCLAGANITSAKPLGVSPITLSGKAAVMAVLPTGQAGKFKLVVLDPDTCGPDNPNGVLATSVIG